MSVYNEEPEWLIKSIDSILNQTYSKIDFIIVLDNPSNNQLKDILLKYASQDNRIRLLINKKNVGLVKSLNKALQYCQGDYIARMDADDISHPDRLFKQLEYLQQNSLDLIGCNVNLFNDIEGVFFTTDKLRTHKFLTSLLAAGTIGIVHSTFFARREVYDVLHGYKMCLHAEDQEFLARVIVNKFKVGNIPETLLDCRYHAKSVTKTNAIYTYKMSSYSNQVFRNYLKTGEYNFDDNYYQKIVVSDKDLERFNRKQILMGEARQNINNNEIIPFIINISKATYYSISTIQTIKINLKIKQYKILENLAFK